MALADNLLEQKTALTALLEAEYSDQNLRDQLLQRLFYIRFLLGELGSGGTGGGGGVADTTATGTITTQNLVPAGVATAGSAVSIDLDSKGTVTIQVTGTYTGALSAQITTDGTNWITPANAVFKNMTTGANSVTIPSASVGIWQIEVIGHAKFRLSALAAFTGTATIALRAAANASQVSVAGVSTAANQATGNASLASIDTKTPSLGQALAAASTPVVLPATQITALTPPTSVGITGTLPAFAATPTFNIGTAPNLTFTNTAFTANAGTNLNTSALAITANQIPAFTNSPTNLGAGNQAVLKASAGAVYKIYCYNKNAATRFFQIHNKATAPVNADVPVEVFPVAGNSALIIDIAFFGASGRACNTGVAWAFSTTETTLTLGTAADQTSSVGYL